MRKTKTLLAIATVAVLVSAVSPSGAAVRKKTLWTKSYDVAAMGQRLTVADASCGLRDQAKLTMPKDDDVRSDAYDITDRAPADRPANIPDAPNQKTPKEYEQARAKLPTACQVSTDRSVDVGGIVFPKIGGTARYATIRVTLTDELALSRNISFSLCQNIDNDTVCGETPDAANPDQVREPSYFGCASPTSPSISVNTRYTFNVFIEAISPLCGSEVAEETPIATRGTIKIVRYIYS